MTTTTKFVKEREQPKKELFQNAKPLSGEMLDLLNEVQLNAMSDTPTSLNAEQIFSDKIKPLVEWIIDFVKAIQSENEDLRGVRDFLQMENEKFKDWVRNYGEKYREQNEVLQKEAKDSDHSKLVQSAIIIEQEKEIERLKEENELLKIAMSHFNEGE